MVEEICPNLFRIKIPLPESPLKYLNAYVVRGKARSLVIDTGFNEAACWQAMTDGLQEIGVTMAAADIFITHLHADHFSLARRLASDTSRIFFNRPEKELMEDRGLIEQLVSYSGLHGFSRARREKALAAHPGMKFGLEAAPQMDIVSPDQQLAYGNYSFACLATPGHSPGHLCLYEAEHRILVSGDHILIDITPNIQCWREEYNPLADYMTSLRQTRKLDVDLVLPGHRRLFKDHRRRIDELPAHHERRLEEVVRIVDRGPRTAYQTVAAMSWDIKADTWDDFPVAQQWFATGEALSHLRYLERDGRLRQQVGENTIRFERA